MILQVIRETDPTLIKIDFTEKEGKEYFYLTVDRERLRTTGFKGIEEFLKKLHIYKVMQTWLMLNSAWETLMRLRNSSTITHK